MFINLLAAAYLFQWIYFAVFLGPVDVLRADFAGYVFALSPAVVWLLFAFAFDYLYLSRIVRS
jgi:hypothetical protein